MKYYLKVSSNAETDIENAVQWYESEKQGLGKKFQKEILKVLFKINENPFWGSIRLIRRKVRSIKIKKYPYIIHHSLHVK